MSDIECPYCGEEQNINHDNGSSYVEEEAHQQECPACAKTFIFHTFRSFDYEVAKADCLNDGEHVFKMTKTYPPEFARMKCVFCKGYK